MFTVYTSIGIVRGIFRPAKFFIGIICKIGRTKTKQT